MASAASPMHGAATIDEVVVACNDSRSNTDTCAQQEKPLVPLAAPSSSTSTLEGRTRSYKGSQGAKVLVESS